MEEAIQKLIDICKTAPGSPNYCHGCPFYIPDDEDPENVAIWYCAFSGSPDTWDIEKIRQCLTS